MFTPWMRNVLVKNVKIGGDGMGEDEENSEANDAKESFAEGEESGNYCDTLEV